MSKSSQGGKKTQKTTAFKKDDDQTCRFNSAKDVRCDQPAVTEWGFCKKHAKTIQSKNAQAATKQEIEASTSSKQTEAATSTKRKVIRPNKWGRFEDIDTHIVFDPFNKTAVGVQLANGKMKKLEDEHVELCKKHGWKYSLDSDDEEESAEGSFESEESEDEASVYSSEQEEASEIEEDESDEDDDQDSDEGDEDEGDDSE
jgi:hypothetical protein